MVIGLALSICQEYACITMCTGFLDKATDSGDTGDFWVPEFVTVALRLIEHLDMWQLEDIAYSNDFNGGAR